MGRRERDHLVVFRTLACFCSFDSCSLISASYLERRYCFSWTEIFHSQRPTAQYLKPVLALFSFWLLVLAKYSLIWSSAPSRKSRSLASRFSSTGTFFRISWTSGWLRKSTSMFLEPMLQIWSICFLRSDSSVLLSRTSMILRQFFWEGARKMTQRRSPMYLVQVGKLEQSSKSKLMSRSRVLTMVKPWVYRFWQSTSSPEQFSCHSSWPMWMNILVRLTNSTDRLSLSNRDCSSFSRSGSIFIQLTNSNYINANLYKCPFAPLLLSTSSPDALPLPALPPKGEDCQSTIRVVQAG